MRFLLVLLLVLWLPACGDGIVIFSLNSGTVVGDPSCRQDGGRFDLLDQAGLVVVVVIRNDTQVVLVNGGEGSCDDIRDGAGAIVQGFGEEGRINATEILLE
jgi:hypothetical protein